MDPQFLDMQRRDDETAVPTQSGFVFPDVEAMMTDVETADPAETEDGRRDALDAVILAGLVSG